MRIAVLKLYLYVRIRYFYQFQLPVSFALDVWLSTKIACAEFEDPFIAEIDSDVR